MKRYALFIVITALLVIMIAAGSAFLSSGARGVQHHPMQELTAYTSLPAEIAAVLSEEYEKEHNIRVNFVQLSPEQLLKRLQQQRGISFPIFQKRAIRFQIHFVIQIAIGQAYGMIPLSLR